MTQPAITADHQLMRFRNLQRKYAGTANRSVTAHALTARGGMIMKGRMTAPKKPAFGCSTLVTVQVATPITIQAATPTIAVNVAAAKARIVVVASRTFERPEGYKQKLSSTSGLPEKPIRVSPQ